MAPTWQRLLGRDMKGHIALHNALFRFRKVEALWNLTLKATDEHGHAYTHVMLSRDDIYWVDDVHLSLFRDDLTIYSVPFGDKCIGDSEDDWPNDQVLLMSGEAASRFLSLYTSYYYDASRELDDAKSVEDFLRTLAMLRGLAWQLVPKAWLPFFLALHQTVDGRTPDFAKLTEQRVLDRPKMCLRLGRWDATKIREGCVHPSLIDLPGCVNGR
eukprot:TRINITY_DN32772_c0_g1_i1.p1 TRINITY_DN32772_c0_g1~~TRINITY_DN32772_c0_g1_i1.p1  ORF type:complete len:214 (-),score=36.40 TRINITY_DN32772_c0_g1_i1:256-897(-)